MAISSDEREPLRRQFIQAMASHGVPSDAARDAVRRFEIDLDTTFRVTVMQVFRSISAELDDAQRRKILTRLHAEDSRTVDPNVRMFLADIEREIHHP